MQIVEVSGRTVDDAVERALEQLGLSRDQVDVDVIREGKRGLLGIGSEEAFVRVTARTDDAPSHSGAVGSSSDASDSESDDSARSGGRRRGRRGGRGRRRSRANDADDPGAEGVAAQAAADDDPEYYDDDLDDDSPGERPPADTRETAERSPAASAGSDEDGDPVDFAGRTLREILTLLDLDATQISVRDPLTPGDGEGMVEQVFDIYGDDDDAADDLGVLIGRRGDTLRSLQYLLNTIVRNHFEGTHVFGVDIEEYRARRERSLIEMARQVAEEVRATGDVITLEPMRAADRRIVHITLREEEGVVTESVGEGSERQVEVMPE